MRGDPLSRATLEISPGTAALVVADYSTIEPVRCPAAGPPRVCRRARVPASVHRVEVEVDAATHYHREHTEIYYILECAAGAAIELDGQRVTVEWATR